MKKVDYNRVIALYEFSGICRKTCVRLVIEICNDSEEMIEGITQLYSDVARIKKDKYLKMYGEKETKHETKNND